MKNRYLGSSQRQIDLLSLPRGSEEKQFEDWYWSYKYGSKVACINYVQRSDLPEEEKKRLIEYHKGNFGITKDV